MKQILRISLVLFATQLLAQSEIPAGTIPPVPRNPSLNLTRSQRRAGDYGRSCAGGSVVARDCQLC
jgi:hypothetical protein